MQRDMHALPVNLNIQYLQEQVILLRQPFTLSAGLHGVLVVVHDLLAGATPTTVGGHFPPVGSIQPHTLFYSLLLVRLKPALTSAALLYDLVTHHAGHSWPACV